MEAGKRGSGSGPAFGQEESYRPRSAARRRRTIWSSFTGPGGIKIILRILVFFFLLAVGFVAFQRLTFYLFGPDVEVARLVTPPGASEPGVPVTLGAVVRNTGRSAGAAFVVAALADGVEVEGPTVDIPAGDSTLVPVQITPPAGTAVLNVVVFDGWRGVRRMETFEEVVVRVIQRQIDPSDLALPGQLTVGEPAEVSFPWVNSSEVAVTLTPSLILRPADGGRPVQVEGGAFTVQADQRTEANFTVDTWNLESGRYSAELVVRSTSNETVGRTSGPLQVEVVDR